MADSPPSPITDVTVHLTQKNIRDMLSGQTIEIVRTNDMRIQMALDENLRANNIFRRDRS